MTHFFDKRDFWGNRLGLWVVVLMAFVAPLCWWSLRQLHLENDLEKWLPDSDAELRSLRWAHEQFPIDERILLTWDGSSINDPRIGQLVEKLAGRPDAHGVKRGGLPYVASVVDPVTTLQMMQKGGVEPQEAVRRLEGTILGAGTLRLRLTESGRSSFRKTKRELQTSMKSQFGVEPDIQDASPDLTPLVSIPTNAGNEQSAGEAAAPLLLSADGNVAPNSSIEHDLQISWKGMRIGSAATLAVANWLTQHVPDRADGKPLVESCFFAPGAPAGLMIGISEAGLADKSETIKAIRSACLQAGISSDNLHLAGSAVTSTELNEEVLRAVWDPSAPITQLHRRSVVLTSVLVSALLAYLLVRSVRLASLVLFVSVFATACSMAIIPVTGGTMNMVLIVMPTLLMVLTMSAAIHVANYWKHAACTNEASALTQTVRMSWKPCFPASLTTAIGFLSLCTSALIPVREFGVYAAAGMMVSLLAVVYGIPSLMQLWTGRPPKREELDHEGWRMFGRLLLVRPGLQSLAIIAVCVGCSLGLRHLQTETKVIRYFPDRARIAKDYSSIETTLAGVMPVETIVRFDSQSQRDMNFAERMELVRRIQNSFRGHSEITGSVSLADFQPVAEIPPEDASFLQKAKYNKRAAVVEQTIKDGEIPVSRAYYTVTDRRGDLNEPADGKLSQPGDELWRISTHVNVMSNHDFQFVLNDIHRLTQEVLKFQPGSHHLVTGTVPVFAQTQNAVLSSLINSFVLAFVLILCVLMVMLRSIAGGIIAMIPNIAPVAVVFGVAGLVGRRVDVGSMITASIALGVAVDGTLHYLTWVRWGMKTGKSRHEAIVEALVHGGPAILQTSVVVVLSLLVLVPAELLMISHFGALMAALITVALIGDLVLLPQLIGGPLGRLLEPKKRSEALVQPMVSTVSDATVAAVVESSVPAPHLPPTDGATKKRKSTPRKHRDAG